MSPLRSGVRVGAAAFALGVALSGHLATGVAYADSVEAGSSAVSTGSGGLGSGRGAATRPSRDVGPARSTPPAAGVATGIDRAAPDRGARVADSSPRSQAGRSPVAVATTRHADRPLVSEPSSRPTVAPSAPRSAGSATTALSAESQKVVTQPERTASRPAASALRDPGQVIARATVGLANAFDRIDDWLSGFPANPVTDLLAGALQLVRRSLLPNVPTIPAVDVTDVTVVEGEAGSTTEAVFTVTLAEASESRVTLGYATGVPRDPRVESATAGEDYTPVSGILTFEPGEISKQVAVPVLGDSIDEQPELTGLSIYATLPPDSSGYIQRTDFELAAGEGAIVRAGWSQDVQLTVTNLTGRALGEVASGQSVDKRSARPSVDLGAVTFTANNGFFLGPYLEIPDSDPDSRTGKADLLLGCTSGCLLRGEVPEPGWFDRALIWAGLKAAPVVYPWVKDAGFTSVEVTRLPDEKTPNFVGNLVDTTIVKVVVR